MPTTLVTATGQNTTGASVSPFIPDPGAYAYSKDDPGEAVMTNVVGPVDQPNKIRMAVTTVADVFKSSDATPKAGQRTDGLNILVQATETWKVTDDTTGDVRYLPMSAHMVLKVPVDTEITLDTLRPFVQRLLGTLGRQENEIGSESLEQLELLLHGVTRLGDTVEAEPIGP